MNTSWRKRLQKKVFLPLALLAATGCGYLTLDIYPTNPDLNPQGSPSLVIDMKSLPEDLILHKGSTLLVYVLLSSSLDKRVSYWVSIQNQSGYSTEEFFSFTNKEYHIEPNGHSSAFSLVSRFDSPDEGPTYWTLKLVSSDPTIQSSGEINLTLLPNTPSGIGDTEMTQPNPPEPVTEIETSPSPSIVSTLPLFENLVWYWSMKGMGGDLLTAASPIPVDIGSTPLVPTYTNAPGFHYVENGAIDSSVFFDGGVRNILMGGFPAELTDLTLGTESRATWSTWLKMDPTNSTGIIFGKDDGNSSRGEWIETNSSHGRIGLVVVYGMGNTRVFTNDVPPNGEWFHVAIVWNGAIGTNSIRIYVNGLEVSSYTKRDGGSGPRNSDSERPFYFGGYPNNKAFKGEIDEFIVWRATLTPAQIVTVYQTQLQHRN